MAGSQVKLSRTAALKKKTATACLFISALVNVPEPAERPVVVCLHPLTFALWFLFSHYDSHSSEISIEGFLDFF